MRSAQYKQQKAGFTEQSARLDATALRDVIRFNLSITLILHPLLFAVTRFPRGATVWGYAHEY